ncbi:hypothetical protein GCM10010199_67020 [Dactylosporangium roseum]
MPYLKHHRGTLAVVAVLSLLGSVTTLTRPLPIREASAEEAYRAGVPRRAGRRAFPAIRRQAARVHDHGKDVAAPIATSFP